MKMRKRRRNWQWGESEKGKERKKKEERERVELIEERKEKGKECGYWRLQASISSSPSSQ